MEQRKESMQKALSILIFMGLLLWNPGIMQRVELIGYDYLIMNTESVQNENILIVDLDEYIKGGADSEHKQLREGYGHIPKPQARKIRNYLESFIDDAERYSYDRRPGRRKKTSK